MGGWRHGGQAAGEGRGDHAACWEMEFKEASKDSRTFVNIVSGGV